MNGKKVLITGAEGALGRVVLEEALSKAAKVGAVYYSKTVQKNPPSFSTSFSKQPIWFGLDLSQSDQVKEVLSDQSFDIWIHCAGGFRFAKIEDLSKEDLDFLFRANFLSALYVLQVVLPQMKKQNFGRIVFVSAKATLGPTEGLGAYAASKAGLNMLVESVSHEVRDFNININAVLPTIINTPANRAEMAEADPAQWVQCEQLAKLMIQLTEFLGNPIRGALIPVEGNAKH